MTQPMDKMPPIIAKELEGVDYEIRIGTRHRKIFVGGLFCGILPLCGGRELGREVYNVRSQIRRAKKGQPNE